jgi:uncharacterized protein (DUF2062 family)
MMTISLKSMKRSPASWLRQGISPQRMALTIALGFAIGCIPMIGVTTALCLVAAFALRLNFPLIQAANYAMMPLQVVLIVPFMRMGGRLLGFSSGRVIELGALLHSSPPVFLAQVGGLAGQALLAWLLVAVPAVALITATLTALLRRLPVMAKAEEAE